jgi:hypothetical protein
MQITMLSKNLWCTQNSWQFRSAIKSIVVGDMALDVDHLLQATMIQMQKPWWQEALKCWKCYWQTKNKIDSENGDFRVPFIQKVTIKPLDTKRIPPKLFPNFIMALSQGLNLCCLWRFFAQKKSLIRGEKEGEEFLCVVLHLPLH